LKRSPLNLSVEKGISQISSLSPHKERGESFNASIMIFLVVEFFRIQAGITK